MSTNNTRKIGEVAGAVALAQYAAVIRPSGAVVVGTAGTDLGYGIVQDATDALGDCLIATSGPTKGIASAAIAKGDKLALAAGGQLATATTGDLEIGEAEEAASGAGVLFDILLYDNKGNVSP